MIELRARKGEIPLEGGILWYDPDYLSHDQQLYLFHSCQSRLPWRQDSIRVYGRVHPQPRLTCFMGDTKESYTYSNIEMNPVPFTSDLQQLKRKIHREFGLDFNCCLANLYRDGADSNGWHSDDEKELGPDPVIGSISLGSDRYFHLRPKKNSSETCKILLKAGSLLIMFPPTQKNWQHHIPKTKRNQKPRINLTFRWIMGTDSKR